MNFPLPSLLALLVLPVALLVAAQDNACCGSCDHAKPDCCRHEAEAADATKPDSARRHPLKGVVVEVYADKGSLLVKHEAIPSYMGAMTMLFRVDAATLKAVGQGDAITADLVERDDDLWLENVKTLRN
jgi:Cu/Ag efflux protein CusF